MAALDHDHRHDDSPAMDTDETPIEQGVAGASAIKKPQSTRAWQQGGQAEIAVGARLAKHLHGRGVRLLQIVGSPVAVRRTSTISLSARGG